MREEAPPASRGIIAPIPTPYDPLEWRTKPLPERAKMVCQSWAEQGYGTPIAVYLVYLLKILLYVGGWLWACSFSPQLGGLSTISDWWLHPAAFQKAILWSMLFEGLGFGCGSGPLTARYLPPFGGFLYWLRPGTTKLALFKKLPLIGGNTRSVVDVLLYAALVVSLVRSLIAPEQSVATLAPIAALSVLVGVSDRTIFLALRAEHYWVTVVVFLFADNWIAGAMAVQLALWFFAGFSKLNHHFANVTCVMTSNSPFTRGTPLRRWVYRNPPDDLNPSTFAVVMSHAGTALELSIPFVFLFADGGTAVLVGVVMALVLHTFITSNVPMGVPIEWNVMVVYGMFALFVAHQDVHVWDLGSTVLAAFLIFCLVVVPIAGNIWPNRVPFLLSMRYYAGNWPYSIWLFKDESYRKLDTLKKSSPWVYDQLEVLYPRSVAVMLVGKVMAFRMMHLQGRCLAELLPRVVDDFNAYEYLDGEIVAGMVLGWNFGDGHLHNEELLENLQQQCGFAPGELRCLFVEAQGLGSRTMEFRIVDAATGTLETGEVDVASMRKRQAWEAM